jgi:hypothetical protein
LVPNGAFAFDSVVVFVRGVPDAQTAAQFSHADKLGLAAASLPFSFSFFSVHGQEPLILGVLSFVVRTGVIHRQFAFLLLWLMLAVAAAGKAYFAWRSSFRYGVANPDILRLRHFRYLPYFLLDQKIPPSKLSL